MKKLSITLIAWLILAITVKAQQVPAGAKANTKNNRTIYTASALDGGFDLGMTVDSNTKWVEFHNMIPNQPLTNYVFVKDAKTITLLACINKDSLNYYRYNIIENDNKLLATDAIPVVKGKPTPIGGKNRIEFSLGEFNIEFSKLTIETYKITARRYVKTTTIYNKEIEPAKVLIVSRGVSGKNGDGVKMEHLPDGFQFRLHDSLTVNSLYLVIKPTDIDFVYHVYIKNLSTGERTSVSNNWMYDYFQSATGTLPYLTINSTFFSEPGNYELQIVPVLPGGFRIKSFPARTTTFHFTVLRSGTVYQEKAVIRFTVIAFAVIICLVIAIFYIIKRRNQIKLAEKQQQKEMAQLQLDAVRSQLNPHFLFNALSGIQNLINQSKVDQANRYLTRFARLTRNVLSNNELIYLNEEISLLDDYLQMEQLRFGFKFEIKQAPALMPQTCRYHPCCCSPLPRML